MRFFVWTNECVHLLVVCLCKQWGEGVGGGGKGGGVVVSQLTCPTHKALSRAQDQLPPPWSTAPKNTQK